MNLNEWLKEWYDDHFVPTRLTWWAQVLSDFGIDGAAWSDLFAFVDFGIVEDRR